MGNNLITILLPVYNDEKYLGYCLESIKNQSYGNFICLVGFNGTVDRSKEIFDSIVGDDSRFIKIDYGMESGKSITLNKMIDLVETDFFCLMDGDDVWNSSKLKNQMEFYGKFDVIGTSCLYIDESGVKREAVNLQTENDMIKMELIRGNNQIINSSCLVRTDVVRNAGGWDSNFEGMEDFDLWIKLLNIGCSFKNLPERLVKHRIHQESNFNSKKFKFSPIDIVNKNFRT